MSAWKEALARAMAGGTITSKELDEIIAKGGGRTGEESERILQACPEWVAEDQARKKVWAEKAAKIHAEQELLVADLRRVGWQVNLVSDLMHTAESYPEAIPVLLNHFQRLYSEGTKEAIVRSLTVREARGIAGPAIIEALRNSQDNRQGYRWALANALTVVADRANREAIQELIEVEADSDVRERLKRALKTAAKR
jgi:hypothetical protein